MPPASLFSTHPLFATSFTPPYPTLSLSIDPPVPLTFRGERGRAKRGQASRAKTHVHQTNSQTTHSWRHRIGELGEGGLDLPLFASPAYQFGSNQYHSSSVFFSTEQCTLSRFDREKTDQEDPANRQSLFCNAFCFLLAACNSLPSTIPVHHHGQRFRASTDIGWASIMSSVLRCSGKSNFHHDT